MAKPKRIAETVAEIRAGTEVVAVPAWEIAQIFPLQGHWSVHEYLALDTNHLVEFSNGQIEVLAMPSQSHQIIVLALYRLLLAFASRTKAGMVLVAPLRVRLGGDRFREPDVAFMLQAHAQRRGEIFWDGADLVIEVISPDDPNRDLVIKREEYAQAGIPEYWIVNPMDRTVTVLTLEGGDYLAHGSFASGEEADSVLLPGFMVDVDQVFLEVDLA